MGALRFAIFYDSITCDEIGIKIAAERKEIRMEIVSFLTTVNMLGSNKKYSTVINRCQSKARRERASFLLEANDSRVINAFEVETICNNKIFTNIRFIKNKVKTVRAAYVPFAVEKEGDRTVYRAVDINRVIKEIELLFRYPFVIKPERGSRGRNVMLIREREQLENVLRNWIRSLDSPAGLLVQEFVCKGFDLRIVVSSYDGVKHSCLASLARVPSSNENFATNTALGAIPVGIDIPRKIENEVVKAAAAVSKTVSVLGVDAIPEVDNNTAEKVIEYAKALVPIHNRVKKFKENFSNSARLSMQKFLKAKEKMDEAFKEMLNTSEYARLKNVLEETLDDAEVYIIEVNSRPDFYINTRNCTGVDVSEAYVKCLAAMF